jgi:hypothetical protein
MCDDAENNAADAGRGANAAPAETPAIASI